MKYLSRTIVILIAVLGIVIAVNYPKLDIISGYAAKSMASSVFVGGRAPQDIKEQDLNVPLIRMAEAEAGANGKSARAAVFGLKERKAVCRSGLGCVLVPPGSGLNGTNITPHRRKNPDTLPFPYGRSVGKDTIFPEIDYQQLQRAVEKAFANNETQRTRTLLIAYKNHILAEKYIGGFKLDTPILGWSMTKSILATLYGILEFQQLIDLSEPAPVPAWKSDERRVITLDNLLRMQSGLDWEEDYSTISDVTRMLFLEADMPRVQMEKQAVAKPGEIWNYSSGTSNLLSGILRTQFKSDQEYMDFPYKELIDRIGMHSMLIETDMTGNFVGSSYGWASTRDWAKFGLLYLNEGEWNGDRIFAEDWVDYVTRPTAHSNGRYGAHFWLNAGGIYPGVPKDLFSANGYEGQYVFVIPSLGLVIVRTGLAEPPDFDLESFLQEVVAAVVR